MNTSKPSNDRIDLQFRDDGHLLLQQGEQQVMVTAKSCFPWSQPGQHISLRNDSHEELAYVAKLEDLSEASRKALEQALLAGEFTFEIQKIHSLRSQFDLRIWEVETEQGPRKFQIKLDDWPYRFADGSILVKDLSGDLYSIKNPDALDAESRKRLWAFRD